MSPKQCMPIKYCGVGPENKVCCIPAQPKPQTKCVLPCPQPRARCPETWPTLVPNVRCCKKDVAQDPLPPPVLPRCLPPRWPPQRCQQKRLDPIPLKYNPPIIPMCKPCVGCDVPPCPPHRPIRCFLDPVIPPCPPPCIPPPKKRHPPEPPYPPFCPILPPCSCPDVPLICHNSVTTYRYTSLCDKAKDLTDPHICYIPVNRNDVAQIGYDVGYCYCT